MINSLLCVGVPRSGSTWLYRVAQEVQKATGLYLDVRKSHHLPSDHMCHDVVYIHRDMLDVAGSIHLMAGLRGGDLAQRMVTIRLNHEAALEELDDVMDGGTHLILRYEKMYPRPVRAVRRVLDYMVGTTALAGLCDPKRIAKRVSIEATQKKMRSLGATRAEVQGGPANEKRRAILEGSVDKGTQIHGNHVSKHRGSPKRGRSILESIGDDTLTRVEEVLYG